jgi:hypothetical protein
MSGAAVLVLARDEAEALVEPGAGVFVGCPKDDSRKACSH